MLSDIGLYLRILNLLTSESSKESLIQRNREIFEIGTTTIINNDLFNFLKMDSFLITEFFDDVNSRVGESFISDINDCNIYVRRLLAVINIELLRSLRDILVGSDR